MRIAASAQKSMTILGLALAIATAGLLAYSNTFHVPFLFDDIARIVDETAIRTVWPPWRAMHNSNRPLAQYTFALNYWFHGYNVVGYHVVNLCIHLAAALTLFGLVRRTLLRCDPIYREGAVAIAFAVGLIWAVHPLTTQAVTYIVQRLESLMALMYLLTLYCFVRAQDSRRARIWMFGSITTCAVGMGCKEVMATAPLIVLWYDRAFVASSWLEILTKRWTYYLLLAASWAVLAWSMLHYTVDYSSGALLHVEGITPWNYLLTQSSVIVHYLRLVFWPDVQCVYYAWPIANSISDVGLPLTIMVTLSAAALWALYRTPRLGFVAGCFFMVLAPTSSIIPIKDLAFEHRMYLPLAAVVVLVAISLYMFLLRLNGKLFNYRVAFLACVLSAAVALGVTTFRRNKVYESEVALWNDTLSKSPRNVKVWVGLGGIFAKGKQVNDAVRCFKTALEIEPRNVKANAIYAGLLIELGDYAGAERHLDQAFAVDPNDRDAIVNMGHLLFATGNYADAQPYFEDAVKIFPSDEELQTALIVNLSYMGHREEALLRSQANVDQRPNSARAHTDLAASLIAIGRSEQARRHCQKAIELDRSLARAHATLAVALADQDLQTAIDHMAQACNLEPTSLEYQLAMGNLQMRRMPSGALKYYEAALRLSPDNIEVLLRIGMAHDASGAPEKGVTYLERVTQLRPDLVEAREMVKAMRRAISEAAR